MTSRGAEFWSGQPFIRVVDHGVRQVCDGFRESLFTRQEAEIWCDDHKRAVVVEEGLKAGELIGGGCRCREKCSGRVRFAVDPLDDLLVGQSVYLGRKCCAPLRMLRGWVVGVIPPVCILPQLSD
ncbi:hypothetical protein LQ424_06440 [Rhodococcus qingshengii]|uniref:hypothetical protein n=1 Tax=Rhodococcus qingshengii TaxID=334542 RepID=UPI00135207B8|nr:hypothetical protein [Rhodococcus qingshengii]MCD2131416.1 hypothetical protein [Rhodococcus qingshengii]